MTNQSKNPVFWSIIAFVIGLALAAWGWDKNESTIEARTHGAVPMIIGGCILAFIGLLGFFTVGNKKS